MPAEGPRGRALKGAADRGVVFDVVVIGGGVAGMVAAFRAAGGGAEVLLVDRGSVGLGTNSALSGGVFAGPTSTYSVDDYVMDTLAIGRLINEPSRVNLLAREIPQQMDFLRSLGLRIAETRDRYFVQASGAGIIPGMTLVRGLASALGDAQGVHALTGFLVEEILTADGRVSGIRGCDARGRSADIGASVAVLAAGGAGALYLKNDNQKGMVGQGYWLAAKAGLDLWDMEFVQFHPLVVSDPRLPSVVNYAPYPEGARLVNGAGEDLVAKYGLGTLTEAGSRKRDRLSSILFEELKTGRVYMDYSAVQRSGLENHPLSPLARRRPRFWDEPIPVSPAAHFIMGGVRTDDSCRTALPGLFACGEVAWGAHGANRRGGNALTECIVMGSIAGKEAAREVLGGPRRALPKAVRERPAKGNVAEPQWATLKRVRQEIRAIAWDHAGVVRNGASLAQGLQRVRAVEGELCGVPSDPATRRLAADLAAAALVLKAILSASAGRKESRGSFQRSDFPGEDNPAWTVNSCARYESETGEFSVTHRGTPADHPA